MLLKAATGFDYTFADLAGRQKPLAFKLLICLTVECGNYIQIIIPGEKAFV
jgi:hypothetical protein